VANMLLSHDGWASPVQGLGPGERTVLWVTGCPRRCTGCISAELQQRSPGVPVETVLEALGPTALGTGRLTVTGGEPFEQAEAISWLIDGLRATGDVELFVYTGYTLGELASVPGAPGLIARADLLMDGPFQQDAGDRLIWRGSDNQVLHCLSQRAQSAYSSLRDAEWGDARPLAVQQLPGHAIRLVGIPSRRDWSEIDAALEPLGYELER
jgi:anaerobic ribonucleoside-triphosphate reductase activating protein